MEIDGKQYTPPEISAMVLQSLKETAEGGLAMTPTGCAIAARIKDEANEKRRENAAERERIAAERKANQIEN